MKTFKIPSNDAVAREEKPPQKVHLADILARMHEAPPAFEDESAAPELDWDVLHMLVSGDLPEEKARLIYKLIYSFKSWFDAHTTVVIKHASKRKK